MQNRTVLYKHKLLTIVSLLILMSISSCEKKDDIAPLIDFQNPKAGVYTVSDTINVKALITDNEQISSVRIRLINEGNQQVVSPYSYQPNSKTFHLDAQFIIDNLYLESGDYFLVIEADDGYNTSKAYQSIRVGALARTLDDVLIVETEAQQSSVYSILHNKKLLKSFDTELEDFIYNPYSQQYLFLSKNGILKAYDKTHFQQVWEVTGLKDPIHTYQGRLNYHDKLIYVNNYLGAIVAYNEKGNIVKQANTIDTEGQISDYFFGEDKIMAFKAPYVSGKDKIEELNQSTGASVWTYQIDFSPKKLLFSEDDLCLVFGNKYNCAKACSLSTLYNVVHPFGDFGTRTLGDAFRYSNYFYILSLNRQIVEYDLSNGGERILVDTQSNVKFYYDDLYQKLYYVDSDAIFYLQYPSASSQLFYQNNHSIKQVIFVYNK